MTLVADTFSTAKDVARIEGPDGEISQFGLRGALVDVDQARAAVAPTAVM